MRYFLLSLMCIFTLTNVHADGEIVDTEQMLESVKKRIVNINTDELIRLLDKDPNIVLIDVRTRPEIVQLGTIRRGQNRHIPRGWLEFRIGDEVENIDTPIIVYCGKNLRSPLAAKTLETMGYTNVKNYSDGFLEWKALGLLWSQ